MWRTLSRLSQNVNRCAGPSGDEFVTYYENLAHAPAAETFDKSFENEVMEIFDMYDTKCTMPPICDRLEFDILNGNITIEEIEAAIDSLKNNKAFGIDMIPAEFIKHNKCAIMGNLCMVLNYIIEQEEFPESWAEGVRTSIHKSGAISDPCNHRGITVLPIFEKVFEIIVQRRLEFINEAFMRKDRFNGGFLKGSQTTDNLFILQSLIERQLSLGQNLIICFIDFSRAFDLMDRNILFYKLIKSGLHGRVINTLLNLYKKTYFRVKHGGYLSDRILQDVGVNQGGNASSIIFRKYLSDLRNYLDAKTGVILSDDEILVHLLWADDLIMASTTTLDAQNQLNGLAKFCSKNKSIVNETKTKYMVFGKLEKVQLHFNGHPLEQVTEYKYLGNIVRSVDRTTGDVFAANYEYLCSKARGSSMSLKRKTKDCGPLSPKLMIYLFDSLVRPVLTYGCAVWGTRSNGREQVDKIHLWYLRALLGIKATSSNVITLGECGSIPPSVTIQANCIIYLKRIQSLSETSMLKQTLNEMKKLHNLGFNTWYGRVCELARQNGIDIEGMPDKNEIKIAVLNTFKGQWYSNLNNVVLNPILRTYKYLKTEFRMEPHLKLVTDLRYRKAITKLRASSHILEIERGRYTRPKTPLENRLCHTCNIIEDEIHFLVGCRLYADEREKLFVEILNSFPEFQNMDDFGKFVFMLSYPDPKLLTIVGKFIHNCFQLRDSQWFILIIEVQYPNVCVI